MPSAVFTFFGIHGSVTDNRPGEERTARVSAGVKSEIDIEDLRGEKIISFSRQNLSCSERWSNRQPH